MSMQFHGVVRAVGEPKTRTFTRNDGTEDAVTRMRVVAESGPLVDKTLEDGRTVKERAYKDFFDVEGWGGTGKALTHVNKGEAVSVSGQLRQGEPVTNAEGDMFYPKDTLRVTQLDFIGPNKAASKGAVGRAVDSVDAEVGANMSGAEIEPF